MAPRRDRDLEGGRHADHNPLPAATGLNDYWHGAS